MTKRIAAMFAASAFATMALVGCGGAGASGSAAVNWAILPSGSSLSAFADRIRLAAGVGAVTSTQAVVVTESTNDTADANILSGTVVRLSPNSFNYDASATLTIRYNETNLNGSSESGLQLVRRSGSGWVVVSGSVVDESGNTVTGSISGLGKYAIRRS